MQDLVMTLAYFWAAVLLIGLTAAAVYVVGFGLLIVVGGWWLETWERFKPR